MIKVRYEDMKCPQCGRIFTRKSSRQFYCTKECTKKANYLRRKKKGYLTVGRDDITGIQRKAQEMGLSYGQYVAREYLSI